MISISNERVRLSDVGQFSYSLQNLYTLSVPEYKITFEIEVVYNYKVTS